MIKVIYVQKLKFDLFYLRTLSDDSAKKPKKKRPRPKGSKNKPKKPKAGAKVKKPQFETKLGKTKPEKQTEKEPKTSAPKKEESTQVLTSSAPGRSVSVDSFTDKYRQNRIFRREMGEPEFFRIKKEIAPSIPILSDAEAQAISRKVQIPINNIPQYVPEHILSPEYAGLSNYELGISTVQEETEEKLAALRNDPNANPMSIEKAEEDLQLIENMVNNYSLTTNVFRTAKGGRDKLKK